MLVIQPNCMNYDISTTDGWPVEPECPKMTFQTFGTTTNWYETWKAEPGSSDFLMVVRHTTWRTRLSVKVNEQSFVEVEWRAEKANAMADAANDEVPQRPGSSPTPSSQQPGEADTGISEPLYPLTEVSFGWIENEETGLLSYQQVYSQDARTPISQSWM